MLRITHICQCWQMLPSPRDKERDIHAHTQTLKHIYTQTQGGSSHNIQLLTVYQMTAVDGSADPSEQDSYSLLHCLMQVLFVSQTRCRYNHCRYCNTAPATRALTVHFTALKSIFWHTKFTVANVTSVRSLLLVKYDCELLPLFS